MKNLDQRVAAAVGHFWQTRERQKLKQEKAGRRDQGSRGAATGGGQLDGFVELVAELLVECGLPEGTIFRKRRVELPGFFRPTKEWDLLVVVENDLLASIEFKSQVGPSFGNNYNNRTEEALGNATDLWTAYREGAFRTSPRPWAGYFMLLEEVPGSTRAVAVSEPHFPVFDEFRDASYALRYELFCRKLVRERLYDAAAFMLSDSETGPRGRYREPSTELSFRTFVASLTGHVTGYLKLKE